MVKDNLASSETLKSLLSRSWSGVDSLCGPPQGVNDGGMLPRIDMEYAGGIDFGIRISIVSQDIIHSQGQDAWEHGCGCMGASFS